MRSHVCLLFGVTADVMAVAAFLAAPRTGGASTDSGDGTGAAAAGAAAFFARAGVEAAAFFAGGCSSFSSAGSAFCFRFLLQIIEYETVSREWEHPGIFLVEFSQPPRIWASLTPQCGHPLWMFQIQSLD